MPEARRIFVYTIRNISVQDAVSIIRGGDSAATDYLRGRSESSLTRLLRPRMESALAASGAYRLVSEIEPRLGGGGGFLGRLFGSSGLPVRCARASPITRSAALLMVSSTMSLSRNAPFAATR